MDLVQLQKTAIRAALSAGELIQKHMNKEVPVEKRREGQAMLLKL